MSFKNILFQFLRTISYRIIVIYKTFNDTIFKTFFGKFSKKWWLKQFPKTICISKLLYYQKNRAHGFVSKGKVEDYKYKFFLSLKKIITHKIKNRTILITRENHNFFWPLIICLSSNYSELLLRYFEANQWTILGTKLIGKYDSMK